MGLQNSFDWRGVAASAASGGIGALVGHALVQGNAFADFGAGASLARASVTGLAAGSVAAIARGGKISIQQVATDAFGNAIGDYLARSSTSGGVASANARESGGWAETSRDENIASMLRSANASAAAQEDRKSVV